MEARKYPRLSKLILAGRDAGVMERVNQDGDQGGYRYEDMDESATLSSRLGLGLSWS